MAIFFSVGLLSFYALLSAAAILYAKRAAKNAAHLVPKLQQIIIGTTTRADIDRLVSCKPFSSNGTSSEAACVTGADNLPEFVEATFKHVHMEWFGRSFLRLWPVYPTTFSADIFFKGDRVNEVIVYYFSRGPFVRTAAYRRRDGELAVYGLPWTMGPGVQVRYSQADPAAMATAWDFQFSCFVSVRGCERAEDLLPVAANATHCNGHYDHERGCLVQ